MNRRELLQRSAFLGAALAAGRVLDAQETTRNTSGAPMDQNAYRQVRLPAKPGAAAVLSDAQRDDLEHHLHCQCGCGLDVYTCRTTDFSCSVSPAMHADVMGLIAGGYTSAEIVKAFRDVYGERVLMAPVKEGFNWVGYIAPFAALFVGGAVVSVLLKRWTRPRAATSMAASVPSNIDASPEELARLRDALKSDDE